MKKFILFFTSLLLFSCAPVYKAPNYKEIAKSHKIIAVLPTNAFIEIKSANDADKIKKQEKIESENLQKSIFDWVKKRTSQGYISVDVQDVNETQRILKEKGIESTIGKSYKELAELLNVDAVITSKVTMAKPMTNAEAFFSTLLTGFFFSSKVTTADISLIDKNSGRMFWNYNGTYADTFASTDYLIRQMMKDAVRNFPYNKDDLNSK